MIKAMDLFHYGVLGVSVTKVSFSNMRVLYQLNRSKKKRSETIDLSVLVSVPIKT